MNGILTPVPDFLSKDQIALLKRTQLKGFSEDEQEVFVQIALRARLDVWTRQLYATKRTIKQRKSGGEVEYVQTLVPVTGIQGLSAIADRTGHYNGCKIYWTGPDGKWREEWLEDEPPAAAKAIVYHKLREHPEVAIARWMSFAGQVWNKQTSAWEYTDFWLRMPDYMLGKCAKALALRGAFPDQLSYIYIAEELQGRMHEAEAASEVVDEDEAKIADNQRREAELMAREQGPGISIVESKPGFARPTPQESLEPAFPEDKIPSPPPAPARKEHAPPPEVIPLDAGSQSSEKGTPAPKTTAQASHTQKSDEQAPDDLDMTPVPTAEATETKEVATPWKNHVIRGVKSERYKGKTIGELNQIEINVIKQQWLPKVKAQWEAATVEQKEDAAAFEAAIAYYDVAKPW